MAGWAVVKRARCIVGRALAVLAVACPAVSLAATPEQAQALSERAAAYILTAGREKAFVDFGQLDKRDFHRR